MVKPMISKNVRDNKIIQYAVKKKRRNIIKKKKTKKHLFVAV